MINKKLSAILSITMIAALFLSSNIIVDNNAFASTSSNIKHLQKELTHLKAILKACEKSHQHHHSQVISLQHRIALLQREIASLQHHHHHHHRIFFTIPSHHHHHHHVFFSHITPTSSSGNRDSQSIHQDHHISQHSSCITAGANSGITGSCSNTSTTTNTNSGGNAHA